MSWGFITSFFTAKTNLLWAALVSVLVSSTISYLFHRREIRHRLATEYEYEQRKELRDIIGLYHGRLLSAGNSLNYRFWNLYSNQDKSWLMVRGAYDPKRYYFHSFVYRFLAVGVLMRQFERKAIFVDARIAEQHDFLFLKYLATMHWCLTDVALFQGLAYDSSEDTDHFFADAFRGYCDTCVQDSNVIEFNDFVELVQKNRSLDPVLRFFDSLCRKEERFRWDRLVVFHLLIVAFINTFGYIEQRTSRAKIEGIAEEIKNREVLANLIQWLPRHGLGQDRESKMLIRTCRKVARMAEQIFPADGPTSAGPVATGHSC